MPLAQQVRNRDLVQALTQEISLEEAFSGIGSFGDEIICRPWPSLSKSELEQFHTRLGLNCHCYSLASMEQEMELVLSALAYASGDIPYHMKADVKDFANSIQQSILEFVQGKSVRELSQFYKCMFTVDSGITPTQFSNCVAFMSSRIKSFLKAKTAGALDIVDNPIAKARMIGFERYCSDELRAMIKN